MKAVLLGIVAACGLSALAYLALGTIEMSSADAYSKPASVRLD